MKVLIVCKEGTGSRPYITEQVNALRNKGVDVDYYFIKGSGIKAYFSGLSELKKYIKKDRPDIIHAHYGLSGLCANLQRKVPVVTSFHGSDINFRKIRPFSLLAMRLSAYNIFVSKKLAEIAKAKRKFEILPCGVDLDVFYPINKVEAKGKLHLDPSTIHILFSGSFSNRIKNAALAKLALSGMDQNIKLIELSGYSREEVNLLLNACDLALMTSLMEGSPQFIKEAMACNCPAVSTDVGSVGELFDNTPGYYLTSFNPEDVTEKINMALSFEGRTAGRKKIAHLDNNLIAKKIIDIYNAVL